MVNRRKFILSSLFSSAAVLAGRSSMGQGTVAGVKGQPVVISTWDAGLAANNGAWEVLGKGGRALDAVEKGWRKEEW